MWLTWKDEKEDEQAISYWNVEAACEIRFLKLRELLKAHRDILQQRGISPAGFGDPENMVMVLIGPPLEEFRILVSVPNDEHQARKIAVLEATFRDALENGVGLLDLKKVMDQA